LKKALGRFGTWAEVRQAIMFIPISKLQQTPSLYLLEEETTIFQIKQTIPSANAENKRILFYHVHLKPWDAAVEAFSRNPSEILATEYAITGAVEESGFPRAQLLKTMEIAFYIANVLVVGPRTD
jgi:hypothetical protein